MANKASGSTTNTTIGDLLLREGLLTSTQLEEALAHARKGDRPLMRVLVESGMLDETRRLNFFRHQFGVPLVSVPTDRPLDPILAAYIPAQMARRHHIIPLRLDRDGLVVAMEDPSDLPLLDDLKSIAGVRIKPVLAPSSDILAALEKIPENTPSPDQELGRAEKFDWVTRLLGKTALWVIALGALAAMIYVIVDYKPARIWFQEITGGENVKPSNRSANAVVYIMLTWGVFTIITYEVCGLVFDDMKWREPDEVGTERKSNRKALVFSIFLGWLGVDRFYLGYWRHGLLKLFTGGLLGVWWLLDIIALLGRKVPDAAGRPLA